MENQNTNNPRESARESQTGQRLSDSQFDEAWNVTGIIRREIQKSTSFIEKLTDYAHAFARNERFDAARGEMVLRDLYKERFGESMNETREALRDQEDQVKDQSRDMALDQARSVLAKIQANDSTPFWKAYDQGGVAFAGAQGVSEVFAKSFLKDVFEEVEGQDFYKTGKELESKHYRAGPESERGSERTQERQTRRSYARSGPAR